MGYSRYRMEKTLEKLETNWDKLAYPRCCGLLAKNPTKFSQAMHNYGFKHLNLPFNFTAFKTHSATTAFLAMRDLGMRGFSITIPYKEESFKLVDEVTEDAQQIGAINTAINTGTRVYGTNTDWIGILQAFKDAKAEIKGKKVLIFGAGGAASAAVYALKQAEAAEIIVSNRTIERARELAAKHSILFCQLDEISKLSNFDIIINSTPLGSPLTEDESFLRDQVARLFVKDSIVFDMITAETRLIKFAKSTGLKTISGFSMLLHQAVEQFKLFTEKQVGVDILKEALDREIAKV